MKHEQKILITGASGFLGTALKKEIKKDGSSLFGTIVCPSSSVLDLSDKLSTIDYVNELSPDIIIHLAAFCGGIGVNSISPYDFFSRNLEINHNIFEAIRSCGNVKFSLVANSVCAYPDGVIPPYKEESIWAGYPETTNAGYGLSKRMMLAQSDFLMRQYGKKVANLLFTNMYGPYDNFDPKSSHVIPAMIRKMANAKENNEDHIICWGSGLPTRDFLFVHDAARAIIFYLKRYDKIKLQPYNIGSGNEYSMKVLSSIIKEAVRYDGNVLWDKSRPDGHARRVLSVKRMKDDMGFTPSVSLIDGIIDTVDYYYREIC